MSRRTWTPPLIPDGIHDPRFVFIDVESSGLEAGSFPVEIAVSDDALAMRSWLVRPEPGWSPRDWERVRAIHGLTWEDVLAGMPARVVADELESVIGERIAISDAPSYDSEWIDRLYASIGRRRPFRIADYIEPIAECLDAGEVDMEAMLDLMTKASGLCTALFPHTHIAGDDARCLAAWHRMVFDPLFKIASEGLLARSGVVAG